MKRFLKNNLSKFCNASCLSVLAVLLLSASASAQYNIIFVVSGPAPSGNGLSWGSPDTSLLQALEDPDLQAGDQIWVAAGTYYPGTIGRASSFQIRDGVAVYGGFQIGQTDTSQRFDYGPGGANETILSGDGGIRGDSTDNFYHVVTFDHGADNSTILNGFTITQGNADNISSYDTYGGGIYNEGSPQIENCAIINNNAIYDGGGIANFTNPADPSAKYPVFKDCIISGNSSSGTGGILNVAYYASLYPTYSNCLITGNSGSAVRNQADNTGNCLPKFLDCTISGNTSNQIISSGLRDTVIIINSIVWNSAGYSFHNIFSASDSIAYSLIDSTPDSNFIDGGNNIIGQDPLFDNPVTSYAAPTTGGDYHLQNGSPALDAGTPAADINFFGIPLYDIEGNSRPQPSNASNIDMGVYEEDEISLMPVELKTFSASAAENNIELKWQTATEVNDYGFEVQRTIQNSKLKIKNWEKIGFVKGNGNSNSKKNYTFIDSDPPPGQIEYRLKQIDNDGKYKYSNIVEAALTTPKKFQLEQNYPNPFNPSTKIRYTIPSVGTHGNASVHLDVYDILGEKIATLVNKKQHPGIYEVTFDGSELASGIYFYRIQAGSFSSVKKMILMK